MSDEPRINDRFPIEESLSPPIIRRPVLECAEAVHVSGFVPHATVRVFANGIELLAEEKPPFGFVDLALNRPVKLGESLTATQEVRGLMSLHSSPPVSVSPLPESTVKNTKPDVGDALYECGQVVPVGNVVPGCRVHVDEDGTEVGVRPAATEWVAVVTQGLHGGRQVTARQIACEGTDHEIAGSGSDPVQVRAAPVPTPPPAVHPASLIVGNDVVTLTGLLVGAGGKIFDRSAVVSSGGLATAEANWFPVSPPLTASSSITAIQELCGKPSTPSDPVRPEGKLQAPAVIGPICAGARHVVVRDTMINATVVVLRNGNPVAYGGAAPGDLVLELGGGASFTSGDVVIAVQYMGSVISPFSDPVTVVGRLRQPVVEILGGHPFFVAKAEEQAIDGPVFPRGSGPGPVIRVQTCCDKAARVKVIGPGGGVVDEPALTELYPGYFTLTWPWASATTGAVPGEVPVGRYTVVARSDCIEREATAVWYVIFDPAEVGGPPRFSFDATAVWFGTGSNSTRGLHYYLHPSDARVFLPALTAVSGMTSAFAAASAVARAEEAMFSYSLSYHTNDVVDLIANYTETQCADDACCLVAMLRAMGIPAHPVTADAGLETGDANWTFDTWVEFLASDGAVVEWRVFHPHEYPGMAPESRASFGTTRGVATKSFNDIIIMADESWVMGDLDDGTADVAFGRNSCQEPQEILSKAPWIGELCEQGYWPVPHWDCTGVRSSGLRAGEGFRLRDEPYSYGETVSGTVHVVNDGPNRRFGLFTVELIEVRAESKSAAETTYDTTSHQVALDPSTALTVPFRFALPETLRPGRDLMLRVRLDEHTAVLRELHVPPIVDGEADWPAHHDVGDESEIRLVIRNVSDGVARKVTAETDAPYALQVRERPRRGLGDLAPGEEREVSWVVRALAQLDSGSLHISVSTENGGSLLIRKPFRITGPPSPLDPKPAHLLPRR